MARTTTKTSCTTKLCKPKAGVLRQVRAAPADLETFIKSRGGIACGTSRRMQEATDWLLLLGTMEKAQRKMDQVLKKARNSRLPIAAA